jgi:hypothetical protein
MTGPLDIARAAWGDPLPDWVQALAVECGRTSAARVAKQLGRSGAVISQVLNRKYPASMDRIEERVRGVLLNGKVLCPALGDLPLQDCQDWREKAATFALGNPTRVRMYRACKACPRYLKELSE